VANEHTARSGQRFSEGEHGREGNAGQQAEGGMPAKSLPARGGTGEPAQKPGQLAGMAKRWPILGHEGLERR
jgi:hypothetical protein